MIVRIAALLIAASSFIVNAGEQRPNIVLIMADDLSHRNLGCYGAVNFETPNLDKLAVGGMRFDHCYSLPLCTPSRVALMTGQHNGRNFFRASTLEADQRTFGHLAKAAGYATCVVGKWKLTGKSKDSTPDRFGFDEHCVTEGLRNDSPRYKNPDILRNGKLEKHSGGEYGPDIVRDHAVDFIERSKDKPFLLYYPMALVHSPMSPVPGSAGYATADQRTDEFANYPDMVRRMDANVGRIIAKLDELGLRERTLVLFTGDNGSKKAVEMKLKDGTVYPGGKGNTSDTGVHVPLIANQPGRVPAGVCDALVGFTDFLPTIAEIAGAKLPRDVPCDGQSFLPHCLGKKDAPRREWIYQWFANNPQTDKVVETVFDRKLRLYGDGRFYHWSADLHEIKPLETATLTGTAKSAHAKLQAALQTSRASFQRPATK
jgi:arylsulfatase A